MSITSADNDLRYAGGLEAQHPIVVVRKSNPRDPTIDVIFCDEGYAQHFCSEANALFLPQTPGQLKPQHPFVALSKIDKLDLAIDGIICDEEIAKHFCLEAETSFIPQSLNIAPAATVFTAGRNSWAYGHDQIARNAARDQRMGLERKGINNLSNDERCIYGCSIVAASLTEWVTVQLDEKGNNTMLGTRYAARLEDAKMPLVIKHAKQEYCRLGFTVQCDGKEFEFETTKPLDKLYNLQDCGIFLDVRN